MELPEPDYSYSGLTALIAAVIDQAAFEYAVSCEARAAGWKAADFLEHCGSDVNSCRKAVRRIKRFPYHRRMIIKHWQQRAKERIAQGEFSAEGLASNGSSIV